LRPCISGIFRDDVVVVGLRHVRLAHVRVPPCIIFSRLSRACCAEFRRPPCGFAADQLSAAEVAIAASRWFSHSRLLLLLLRPLLLPLPAGTIRLGHTACVNRSFQWAGAFVLLLVSAWFVDMFVMTARVCLYLKRCFTGGSGAGAGADAERPKKFSLPLLAFPLMWLVVFVILVAVASVQGSKEPVTRTVEVCFVVFCRRVVPSLESTELRDRPIR